MQEAFDLLASEPSVATHVDCLVELRDLEIERLLFVLSLELGNLSLNFLHLLNFAFE